MTTPTNPFALDTPPTAVPAPTPVPAAAPAPASTQQPAAFSNPPIAPPVAPPADPFTSGDPFSGPAPQASRPRVRDMVGRLLLVIPHKVETVPNRKQPGETQERMTADVVVLDGGPLAYGGAPEKLPSIPHDKTAQVPYRVDRLFISSAGLVSQSRQALAKRLQGQPGMVLGRLGTGEAKSADYSPPYLLSMPTEQDKQIARQYLAGVDPFA